MVMISCILLAAGLSRRFGSPKAMAKLNGETIIEHIEKMLLKTKIEEVVVVLGAHYDQVQSCILNHKRVRFVYNKDYILGQTTSFQIGLQNVSSQFLGAMLYPVDYPLIKPSIIDTLCIEFLEKLPSFIVPSFEDKKGHPPIFHRRLREELLGLDHDVGINRIIHRHEKDGIILPVSDPGVIKTFNTPEEFMLMKEAI